MSRHPLPPKPKISPEWSTLMPERHMSMIMMEEKSKVRPLNGSMKSSLITLSSESRCMRDANYSPLYSTTIPSSLMSSALRCIIIMENASSRLPQPEHMQSHRVNESITSLPSQNLLERMGLGNQMLMIRLGLLVSPAPAKLKPAPTQTLV